MAGKSSIGIRVAIKGQAGSYHDQAAAQYFGAHQPVCCDTFAEAFAAALGGRADVLLVATQNTIFGTLNEVCELAAVHPELRPAGMVRLAIHHCLIGLPGAATADVRVIHSDPVALAQCGRFLRGLPLARQQPEADTIGSLPIIIKANDPAHAAIASPQAAAQYGLPILASDIADAPNNVTTFTVYHSASYDGCVSNANKC